VHLEQQLAKSSEQLSQLQRDNIKLLRYKRQFEVAAQSLQGNAAAKAAAEAQSQGAGLKATAAAERADRLAAQVRRAGRRSAAGCTHCVLPVAERQ
jgi:hypothetical protein